MFADYCSRNNVSQAGSVTLAFTFSGAVFADYCSRTNVSQAGSVTLAFSFSGAVFADYCSRTNVSQAGSVTPAFTSLFQVLCLPIIVAEIMFHKLEVLH